MCGISGSVHRDPDFIFPERRILEMRDSMFHRGPDDAGVFAAPGIALGSRRLAILDLSEKGHMPMCTSDGRFTIVYNGEVYNYRELRRELEATGIGLKSDSDTEVVLHLYSKAGPAMLSKLNGMFAFAIWDSTERQLFLARDRLGVKPLFYAVQDGTLHFASEIKALFTAGVPRIFDQSIWPELLTFRHVAGQQTPFKGVRRLLPAHYMLWKNHAAQIKKWWNLADRTREHTAKKPTEAVAWFRETFDDSVNLRRISDVPVGVLLSGGLDSGSVASSLATQAGAGVASFTIRFNDPNFDEGALAKRVAEKHRLEFHELIVRDSDLLDLIQKAGELTDEPLMHASDVHLFAISRYAKSRVTVLLSGEGADELLGGYVRYKPLRYPTALKLIRPTLPVVGSALKLNGRFGKLERLIGFKSLDDCVLFNNSELRRNTEYQSDGFEYRRSVLAEAKLLYPRQPFRQAMYLDMHTYLCSLLDRNDRMTMGASIECRVPFLDYRLVEGVAALPSSLLVAGGQSKFLLREAVGFRLPSDLLKHRKWGFGVPWSSYLRRVPELRDRLLEIPKAEALANGPFDKDALRSLVQAFLRGDRTDDGLVVQLFMISMMQAPEPVAAAVS